MTWLVPLGSYVKFLNVEVLKMSSYFPSPPGSQPPPFLKGELQRVGGEEHLPWSHEPVQTPVPPFTS